MVYRVVVPHQLFGFLQEQGGSPFRKLGHCSESWGGLDHRPLPVVHMLLKSLKAHG